ncbi:unnamed protein product [Closterium sp. Yama58-4]|nr:unnamed protein product [Closterium sp. Yama58-4]
MAFVRFLVILLSASAALSSIPSAHAQPLCPRPPTVAQVNLSAYAGRWFEIGTSARFKLQRENGLVCNQARYTFSAGSAGSGGSGVSAGGADAGTSGVSIRVENSGRLVASPAVLQSMGSVAGNSRDACIALANVSSAAASALELLQSQPQAAVACSQLDFHNASLNLLSNQLLLHASASADKASQIASAAATIQNASANCDSSVSSAAASILTYANSLRDALNRVGSAVAPFAGSDILSISLASVASVPLPFGGIPTLVFGQAVPSTDDPAKLTVTFDLFPSTTTEPNYWILALDGSEAEGYSAALVFSCTEPQGSDPTPRVDVWVISRSPDMPEDELQELLGVLSGYGVGLGCDNPFVRTVQDRARCGY